MTKKEYKHQWYLNHRVERAIRLKSKIANESIKERELRLVPSRNYYKDHKIDIALKKKKYYNINKIHITEQKSMYDQLRYKCDVNFKLIKILRSRLNSAIKNNHKSGSAVRDLGCSVEFLKQYLESQFLPGMTWNNYGTYWQIDHIVPLFIFDLTDRDQFVKAVNYANLQPLTIKDHIKKTVLDRSR